MPRAPPEAAIGGQGNSFARKAETGAADPVLTRISEEDTIPWYKKPNLRYLYFMLFPTCMGIELTSGFDSQMINALQMVEHWDDCKLPSSSATPSHMGNPEGALRGIIAAAYPLGSCLSLPFIPWVNDRFGRRWSIFGGSIVMVIGAIIQGFSAHVGMYIVARMILGFGIPTCIVSGSSLIGELSYPKERPILTSLFNVAYFVGQIMAAGITFGTNTIQSNMAWRIPSWLQICPSLLQIFFVFFLPESPRWLISKDRGEEAHAIFATYHSEGTRGEEFVRAEFAQIQTTLKLELEAASMSWSDILATKGNRRRALVSMFLGLFTQWSGNTLISYYLGNILRMIGMTNSQDIHRINLSIACWSLICGFTVAMLVRRFRRRVMYMTCTISLFTVYVAWTVSMERAMHAVENDYVNQGASIATIFWIFAYSPAYNMGYNALTYTYLVELWPYALRSRGISFFQLFGRIANFFTTFVNPIGLDNSGWRYLIFYCCWLLFEIVFVYFFFPETAGRTLEELAFLFEDRDKAEAANQAVEKAFQQDDMAAAGETTVVEGRSDEAAASPDISKKV
ncbi:general substrate transporter [Sodiomyces alkalinus F11]|uniref:General substrate transporter n=1 Tax=Sodiomyces alkalinus (strain CBS 110278 / VKM F-3762 / F11) TaxID=1314773 RepID=A0A3N2Q5E8_SODAK|nr:general substrate transporter [Sodiomyces alkalinus F11]ROT41878.1 general substrate transporter [Sodiomyces alkalinus F11]